MQLEFDLKLPNSELSLHELYWSQQKLRLIRRQSAPLYDNSQTCKETGLECSGIVAELLLSNPEIGHIFAQMKILPDQGSSF